MVVVLSMVVVLGAIVAFAIIVSGQESRNTGRLVHNMTLQEETEATLQYGRNFFANNYGPNGTKWNMYLSYFVDNPVILSPASAITASLNTLQAATFSDGSKGIALINPNIPSGTTCFIYCHDNVDELPPKAKNNPRVDNDGLIYVGAVCVQQVQGSGQSNPLVAELVGPLFYTAAQYSSQGGGGPQGLNNASQVPGFR